MCLLSVMEQISVHPHLSEAIKRFSSQWNLTPRERDVLHMIVLGTTRIKDVAANLHLSPHTVNNYVNSIFAKSRTRSKSELLTRMMSQLTEELLTNRLHRQAPRVLLVSGSTDVDPIGARLATRGCRVSVVREFHRIDESLLQEPAHFVLVDLDDERINIEHVLVKVQEMRQPWISCVVLASELQRERVADLLHTGIMAAFTKPATGDDVYNRIMSYFTDNPNGRLDVEAPLLAQTPKGRVMLELTPACGGRGGVFVAKDQVRQSIYAPVMVGDRIDVELRIPGQTEPGIETVGEIVWMREHDTDKLLAGVGVRTVVADQVARERWQRFLHANHIRPFIPLGARAAVV